MFFFCNPNASSGLAAVNHRTVIQALSRLLEAFLKSLEKVSLSMMKLMFDLLYFGMIFYLFAVEIL